MRNLLLVFLWAGSLLRFGLAQQLPVSSLTVSGVVRDARTQRPLGAASVFLANSTYGTTTDSLGRFTLVNVPAGQYELMASYLGYQLYTVALPLRQPTTLAVALQPTGVALEEVSVRPAKNNAADFRRFVRQFLGSSAWSQQCHIENPEAVVVLYDQKAQVLTAVAPRGLRVLNPALGYRITFHQFNFRINYLLQQIEFVAAPSFEELPTGTDARLAQRQRDNRRRAYAGSLPHFLRSVRDDRLAQAGFVVRRLLREADTDAARQRIAQAGDSIQQVLVPSPGIVARVYRQPLLASQLSRTEAATGRVWLRFPAAVQVVYQGEQPDASYAAAQVLASNAFRFEAANARGAAGAVSNNATYATQPETSELQLLQPEALILPTGYLLNPLSVKVQGYWAFEKIGEALPLNYELEAVR